MCYTLLIVAHEGFEDDLSLPPALAGNLWCIGLDIVRDLNQDPESIRVDLARFAECKFLEGVEVDVGKEHCYRGELRVSGLGRLPAACKYVVLVPCPGGAGIFVEPEFGWQVNVEGGPGGRVFVHRMSGDESFECSKGCIF